MQFTSDRLEVQAGERVRALFIVRASRAAVAAAGGFAHLGHALEDVGFSNIGLFATRPPHWRRVVEKPATSDLEWLLWGEFTAKRSASLARDLTDKLTIADAWEAEPEGDLEPWEDGEPLDPWELDELVDVWDDESIPLRSLYAVTRGAPRRLVGFVVVFGVAYPLFAFGGA